MGKIIGFNLIKLGKKGKRKIIYIISSVLTITGVIGLLMIETTENITDDLSKDGDLYTDLAIF